MSTVPAPDIKPHRRILVMRYRFIGDTLLTVPFLRNLRAAYPHARIEMLVAPNSGEVLRDCPYVDELIVFDTSRRHRYEQGEGRRKTFWHYVRLLRERQYDTAFVLKRSFSSAALAFLAGIPERIGFDTEKRGFLLTGKVPYHQDMHEMDCFLEVLKAVDIPIKSRFLEGWWNRAEEEKARHLLPRGRNIVLHLTSSNRAKQWPEFQAAQLAEWLLAEPDVHLHALGAPSDSGLYVSLQQQLPPEYHPRLHIHCGTLNLTESMAFLKHVNLVVGVDSGTLHMAAAVHTPVVALFGPMDERKWGPVNAAIVTNPVACRPCNLETPCHNQFKCMAELPPAAVLEKILEQPGVSPHAGLV